MNRSRRARPEPRRLTADTAIGLGLVGVGLFAAVGSFRIAPDYDGSTTARLFPLMTSGAITLMGVLSLRPRPSPAPRATDKDAATGLWPPFAILAVAFGYLWAMGKIGYLLSTAMAAPAALWLFGVRSPLGLVGSAVLCPAAYHLVFFELLGAFPPFGSYVDLLLLVGY